MGSTLLSDAERMDRHYRFQRYVYDLTRTYYLLGRWHLIREIKPAPGQSVLEIGCGTAWNLTQVARRYPQAVCLGVDISEAMLETARTSLSRKGLTGRITLRQGDATNFDPAALFGREQFDRVFLSYSLSMIPQWEQALEHAATMVAPGGSLHIADFGQCGGLPAIAKRALFAFLRHYSVTPRAELDDAIRACAHKHGFTASFTPLYRGYADYAVLTRNA